jgi:hypothetical protein
MPANVSATGFLKTKRLAVAPASFSLSESQEIFYSNGIMGSHGL